MELEDWVIIWRPEGSALPRMTSGLANEQVAVNHAKNMIGHLTRCADEIIYVGPARMLRAVPGNHWPAE